MADHFSAGAHTAVAHRRRGPVAVVEQTSVVDEWQASASRSFVPLTVEASAASPFHARMEGKLCDGVFFSTIWASPHTVVRDESPGHTANPDCLEVTILQSGSASLIQDGRVATLEAGDVAMHDTSRPYTLAFEGTMAAAFALIPYDLIGIDRRVVNSLTAVRLTRGGFLNSVTHFLRCLPQLDVDAATATRLTHNAVDLIQTVVTHELSGSRYAERSAGLMLRIDEYINAHLHQRDLTPRTIAAAHFISARQLHALFQQRGVSVSRLIKQRQLEHARRDLIDPLHRHESIGAIAASWGFPIPAQFSKSFRDYTGMSPREYRSLTT